MQKKTDTAELDIPKDDIDCWERYPKHHWVYDMSRLLDAQGIKWAPFSTPEFNYLTQNIVLYSYSKSLCNTGVIHIRRPEEERMWTEVYIVKGEVKLMRHIDPELGPQSNLVGGIELRINAFVTLHFAKFTGVITVDTYGNDIYRIQLRAYSDLSLITNTEIIKLTKRIYKRNDLILTGLTDRVLHETLAS